MNWTATLHTPTTNLPHGTAALRGDCAGRSCDRYLTAMESMQRQQMVANENNPAPSSRMHLVRLQSPPNSSSATDPNPAQHVPCQLRALGREMGEHGIDDC